MDAGVYLIRHKESGKCYIGQSKAIKRRWYEHKRGAENSLIAEAIKQHGIEAFDFEVLGYYEDPNERDDAEEKAISQFNAMKPNGYNSMKRKGHLTEEAIEAIRSKLKGRQKPPRTKEHIENLSRAVRGKTKQRSNEHKKKISENMKARWAYSRDEMLGTLQNETVKNKRANSLRRTYGEIPLKV